MGYTHYWTQPCGCFKPESFKLLKQMVSKIVAVAQSDRYRIGINWEESDLHEGIALNGGIFPELDNDITEVEGETLWLLPWHSVSGDYFCKTNRKPYDTVVIACLIALKIVAYEETGRTITVSTDGDPEDWEDGINLFCEAHPEFEVRYAFEVNLEGAFEMLDRWICPAIAPLSIPRKFDSVN